MEDRRLERFFGGRDIVRHIRTFGVGTRSLELQENDLLEELATLGDPIELLEQAIDRRRRQLKDEVYASQVVPFERELSRIADSWSARIGTDLLIEIGYESWPEEEEAQGLIPKIPWGLQGVLSGNELIISGDPVKLYRMYRGLIYLDSQNHQGEINGAYTSYWVDENELI